MNETAQTSLPSDIWYVKARKQGEKRYKYVGSEGSLTGLRVHALMFTHIDAQDRVATLAMDNPEYDFKTQRMRSVMADHQKVTLQVRVTAPASMTTAQIAREVRTLIEQQCFWSEDLEAGDLRVRSCNPAPKTETA